MERVCIVTMHYNTRKNTKIITKRKSVLGERSKGKYLTERKRKLLSSSHIVFP